MNRVRFLTFSARCVALFGVRAMLDPKRDLAGATPEALARALLRPLGPRPGAKDSRQNNLSNLVVGLVRWT